MNEKTDRRVLAIFTVVLIDVLGMTIMFPLLPFYSEHFGASPQVVGFLVSSYALCQFIAGPILGHLSDRFGRRPILIVSQIGTFVGFLILANARSLTWVFVSRIVDGITAGNLSTAQAYITDVTEPRNRAKVLGKIGIAFGIGFFLGPALTAFLVRFGFQAPIYGAAALSFLSIMGSTFLLPKEPPPKAHAGAAKESPARAFTKLFRNRQLALLLVEITIFYFAFAAFMSGFALFAEHRFRYEGAPLTARQVGYAFTYFGFLQILIQGLLIGRLVDKLGERRVQFLGFATSAIGYGILALIANPFLLALTGLFSCFGGGVLRPVLLSQLTANAPPQDRGKVIGVSQSLQSVAQILAPIASTAIIGGPLIGLWGLFPGIISLVGVLTMLLVSGRNASTVAAQATAP